MILPLFRFVKPICRPVLCPLIHGDGHTLISYCVTKTLQLPSFSLRSTFQQPDLKKKGCLINVLIHDCFSKVACGRKDADPSAVYSHFVGAVCRDVKVGGYVGRLGGVKGVGAYGLPAHGLAHHHLAAPFHAEGDAVTAGLEREALEERLALFHGGSACGDAHVAPAAPVAAFVLEVAVEDGAARGYAAVGDEVRGSDAQQGTVAPVVVVQNPHVLNG